MIDKDSLLHLVNQIKKSKGFKNRISYESNFEHLINFQSLLIFILFLLFLEWFIRRRYINY